MTATSSPLSGGYVYREQPPRKAGPTSLSGVRPTGAGRRIAVAAPLLQAESLAVALRRHGWTAVPARPGGRADVLVLTVDGATSCRPRIGRLKRALPAAAALAVGPHDGSVAFGALLAGADGYLPHDAGMAETHDALTRLLSGQAAIGSALLRQALEAGCLPTAGEGERLAALLTRRERQALRGAADGLDTDGISRRLGIRPSTARTYIQQAIGKLGADNRPHAVAIARRHRLLDPEPESDPCLGGPRP
ncbi:response regulator transcription factor [Kitasatospora sp. NPDC058046]|uniref:response regulator transcription factor n=1 Tax=Kitasatospora sp. NPDC058046 TaxID=3346312 RepID=UPI0036DEFBA1